MVNTYEIMRRMRHLKVTQKQLGELTALSQSMISFIILGKRDPKLSTMVAIAKALECKVDDLLIG